MGQLRTSFVVAAVVIAVVASGCKKKRETVNQRSVCAEIAHQVCSEFGSGHELCARLQAAAPRDGCQHEVADIMRALDELRRTNQRDAPADTALTGETAVTQASATSSSATLGTAPSEPASAKTAGESPDLLTYRGRELSAFAVQGPEATV